MDKLKTKEIISPRNDVINRTREFIDILTRKYLESGLDEPERKFYSICRRKIYSAAIGKLALGDSNRIRFERKIRGYDVL